MATFALPFSYFNDVIVNFPNSAVTTVQATLGDTAGVRSTDVLATVTSTLVDRSDTSDPAKINALQIIMLRYKLFFLKLEIVKCTLTSVTAIINSQVGGNCPLLNQEVTVDLSEEPKGTVSMRKMVNKESSEQFIYYLVTIKSKKPMLTSSKSGNRLWRVWTLPTNIPPGIVGQQNAKVKNVFQPGDTTTNCINYYASASGLGKGETIGASTIDGESWINSKANNAGAATPWNIFFMLPKSKQSGFSNESSKLPPNNEPIARANMSVVGEYPLHGGSHTVVNPITAMGYGYFFYGASINNGEQNATTAVYKKSISVPTCTYVYQEKLADGNAGDAIPSAFVYNWANISTTPASCKYFPTPP